MTVFKLRCGSCGNTAEVMNVNGRAVGSGEVYFITVEDHAVPFCKKCGACMDGAE